MPLSAPAIHPLLDAVMAHVGTPGRQSFLHASANDETRSVTMGLPPSSHQQALLPVGPHIIRSSSSFCHRFVLSAAPPSTTASSRRFTHSTPPPLLSPSPPQVTLGEEKEVEGRGRGLLAKATDDR